MSGSVEHKIYVKENKKVEFSATTMEKVREMISHYPEGRQKSALLPVLHMAQEEFGGYLSVDAMDYVASLLKIQPVEVYEVATFYSMFYLEPTGKYVIEVCRTGACAISGGEQILDHICKKLDIKEGETTPDGLFSLKTVECLGACGNAPVMQINTKFHEELSPGKIDRIIEHLREQTENEKPEGSKWADEF